MNIEQTLEALDHVIASETMMASVTIVHSTTSILCGNRAKELQSLRDALRALVADAETLRKMKEVGPVGEVIRGRRSCDVLWEYHAEVQPGMRLYALPDEVTK